MIVYSANKRLFVEDVKANLIATKILDLIRERGFNAGQEREFAAWQNSMQFMRNIIDDSDILKSLHNLIKLLNTKIDIHCFTTFETH